MIEKLTGDPVYILLLASMIGNIIQAFMMRDMIPPAVAEAIAGMIPVEMLDKQAEKYEKMAHESNETSKLITSVLATGGVGVLGTIRDAFAGEDAGSDMKRLQKFDLDFIDNQSLAGDIDNAAFKGTDNDS